RRRTRTAPGRGAGVGSSRWHDLLHSVRTVPIRVTLHLLIRSIRMSFGDEEGVGFETARGRDWPSVRQYNVFLANRLGALLDLVRCFETTDVKLVALTVVETADCAIIRTVPSGAERAYEILPRSKLPSTESDLLVATLPGND